MRDKNADEPLTLAGLKIAKDGSLLKSKYINFVKVFGDIVVMSKKQKEPLAKIIYYPRWKQCVLEPLPGTVFNDECLMDIIWYIRVMNKAKSEALK